MFVSVFSQATSAPIFRMQEQNPQFRLNNLEPGREYQFLVYAVNAKGRSEPPVVIERVRVAAQLGPYGKLCKFSVSILDLFYSFDKLQHYLYY